MRGRRRALLTAAALDFGIALGHVVIIAIGPPAYGYFGTGRLASLASQGSLVPAALTLGVSGLFVVFGLYALAGAGVVQRLPLTDAGVVAIGIVYTLRGLMVVPELIRLFGGGQPASRQLVFSAVALGIGALHLAGAVLRDER